MNLIPYAKFGVLRLAQFAGLPVSPPDPSDPGAGRRFKGDAVVELPNWEFMGKTWVGEAVGFTEWLRLKRDPDVLRSMALSLDELPPRVLARILREIRLPLKRGMKLAKVKAVLGEPVETTAFVAGRKDYAFVSGTRETYRVECTMDDADGLVYLLVRRADPASAPAAVNARARTWRPRRD